MRYIAFFRGICGKQLFSPCFSALQLSASDRNYYGQSDVSEWTDTAAISTEWPHTVGLKADGTAVAVGYNKYGQCDVSDWTNIKLPN